jgi:predicted nucleic acid-binding protein
VANALSNYSQRGLLPEKTCLEGIHRLEELPIRYINEDWGLINDAFKLATKLDVAIYDAIYLTIATNSDAAFITADHRLYKKVKNKVDVELLGGE